MELDIHMKREIIFAYIRIMSMELDIYIYETLFLVFLLYESLEGLEIKKNVRS